jgi:tetratricopeptide (TPR) repeat protein
VAYSERDYLKTIADQLHEWNSDYFDRGAGRIADGIRMSGIPGTLNSVNATMTMLASTSAWQLSQMSVTLTQQTSLLEQLLTANFNPEATAALELTRRGTYALQRDLLPEAIADLTSSVNRHPYDCSAWLALGFAYAQGGLPRDAANSFAKAVRYSLRDRPAFACGAGLLAAQAYDEIGDSAQAHECLQHVASVVSDCPEVDLALSRRTSDRKTLRRALENDPELAVVAEAGGVAHLRTVCQELSRAADGPIAAWARIEACHSALVTCLNEAGQPPEPTSMLVSINRDSSPAVQLAAHGRAIRHSIPTLAEIVRRVRSLPVSGTSMGEERVKAAEETARKKAGEAGSAVVVAIVAPAVAIFGVFLFLRGSSLADSDETMWLGILLGLGGGGIALVSGFYTLASWARLPAKFKLAQTARSHARLVRREVRTEHKWRKKVAEALTVHAWALDEAETLIQRWPRQPTRPLAHYDR